MLTESEVLIIETLLIHSKYSFSINGLVKKLQENYNRGTYATINKRIKIMEKQEKILTKKLGKAILINLNFSNSSLLNSLNELENYKRDMIIAEYPIFKEISDQLISIFDKEYLHSFYCSYTKSNLRRNRIELTIITLKEISKTEKQELSISINSIATIKNIRIDYLILTVNKYNVLLQTEEFNHINETLYNRIVLLYSNNFWKSIVPILSELEKIDLKYDNNYQTETDLSEISEEVIIYNLNRFGYTEFGSQHKIDKKISNEYLIITILLKSNQRWLYSIKIIMDRNQYKLNLALLVFLCKKYSLLEKLIEIIKAT
ncbi:MAG: hypothetical protein H0X03_07400 [Nitrosopumilus sp.]|nr:hypothetical protein [Nitrosopumilus sp.]